MNREDIIRIALECGWSKEYLEIGDERLERFAALAASAEREALIEITQSLLRDDPFDATASVIQLVIRARGQE